MGNACGIKAKSGHNELRFVVFGPEQSGKSTAISAISMGEETNIKENEFNLGKKQTFKGSFVKAFNYGGTKIKTFEVVKKTRDESLKVIKEVRPAGLIFVTSAKEFQELKRSEELFNGVLSHFQMGSFGGPVLVVFSKRDEEQQLPVPTIEFSLKLDEAARHKELIRGEIRSDRPRMMIEAFDELLKKILQSHSEGSPKKS